MATRKAAAKKGAARKSATKSAKKGAARTGAAKKGAAKKGAAKRGATKAASRKMFTIADFNKIRQAVIDRRQWVMYGLPPDEVIATGNIALMRQMLDLGRRHLAEVHASVARLEAATRGR